MGGAAGFMIVVLLEPAPLLGVAGGVCPAGVNDFANASTVYATVNFEPSNV